MEIIDLSEDYKNSYIMCLEEWSDEMKEAGDHKESWFQKMKDMGLKVKLALNNTGLACGMIQYIPIQMSPANGEDLYFINCIWVHGYKKKGVGNCQKRGMGKALLKAAEEDVKSMGKKGLVAWGLSLPFWMKASWFKKHGYTKVDKNGMMVLLWKPFSDDAEPPVWIKQKMKLEKTPGQVTVTVFINGWCQGMNMVFERAKKAASEFDDRVVFKSISTFAPEILLEWGILDGLFIDDKEVKIGPPPSYEKIKKLISRKLKKLN